MQVVSAIIILLAWVSTGTRVAGQTTECAQSLNIATLGAQSNPACNCPNQPVCADCVFFDLTGTTSCSDNCEYCDSASGACGSFAAASTVASGVGATFVYYWTYTKGRTGSLSFEYESVLGTCSVKINGQECTACAMYKCNDETYDSSIDCTNLEAGATASSPCTSSRFGGLTSVDESARGGILLPLVIPYYACEVASSSAPVAIAPTASPPTTSDTTSPIAPAGTPTSSGTGSSPTASPPTTSDTTSPIAPAGTPTSSGTGSSPTASPPTTNSGTISPTATVSTFPPFIQNSSANKLMPLVKTFLIPLFGTATYHLLFGR